jgi:hypothetical protein
MSGSGLAFCPEHQQIAIWRALQRQNALKPASMLAFQRFIQPALYGPAKKRVKFHLAPI